MKAFVGGVDGMALVTRGPHSDQSLSKSLELACIHPRWRHSLAEG